MQLVRQYALPLLLALLLHAGVGAALLRTWQPEVDEPRRVTPRIIHSKLLAMAATPPPKEAAKPPPPVPSDPVESAPAEPKPDKPPPEPEVPRPDADAERRAQEAARRAQEEAQRKQRLLDMFEESTALAFQEEVASQEEAETDAVTMSYFDAIMRAIVSQWSRPPSARNEMQARFLVELTPAGDLLSVTLLESSGHEPFDRSAEAAVRKVRRFEVPPDRRLFEKHFRRITLLFKPEDLLR